MRINFDSDYSQKAIQSGNGINVNKSTSGDVNVEAAAFAINIGGNNTQSVYHEKQTMNDFQSAMSVDEVQMKRDYMSVMSLSMSDEDYAEMVRTGKAPEDMDVADSVTIMDDIKAALIRGGTQVAGYTDNIDKEALEEITGSIVAADQLISSMLDQDVPVNTSTVSEATDAIAMAMDVLPLADSAVKYLIDNDKAPTIMNIYQATHAGSSHSVATGAYYAQNGYLTRAAGDIDKGTLLPQIEDTIRRAGYEVNEKTTADAEWLVDQGIGLTTKTFNQLEMLEGLRNGVDSQSVINSVSIAMSAGIAAGNANLTYEESIYTQAEEYLNQINEISDEDVSNAVENGIELSLRNLKSIKSSEPKTYVEDSTPEMLHARRVLEEVRLSMSVEANRILLRSNFQIDITPMEELIDALKLAEKSFENALFPSQDSAVSAQRAAIYREVKEQLPYIPAMPAAIVGELDETGEYKFSPDKPFDLHLVYESGVIRRDAYRQAGETYEALMTAPRADMGDSIRKAFRNVDDILEDLDLDINDDNRRAVRILGYNTMEITPESIEQVREADVNLRRTLDRLTPHRVITMIREDVNPMNMTVSELNDYLDTKEGDPENKAANYARFLMQLERQQEISDLERESYIGIYRMISRIDRTDDAAIGSLLEMGTQTTFSNLLSSMRTAAKGTIDIKISDDFGGVDVLRRTPAIDEQVNAAFTENLLQMGQPVSLSNLDALNAIRHRRGEWFKTVRTASENDSELEELVVETLEDMTDADSAKSSYTNMLQAFMNTLSEEVLNQNKYIDVKMIQSSMRQISLLQGRASEEEYDFPTTIDGEATSIRLRIKHEVGAGILSISMETETLGKVAAEFDYSGNASGYIAFEQSEVKDRLETFANEIEEKLSFVPELVYAPGLNLDKYDFELGIKENNQIKANDDTESADINNTELYRIAREFIGALKKI